MSKPWKERIADAKKRGKFTSYEVKAALDWTRCAVGEQKGKYIATGESCNCEECLDNGLAAAPVDDELTNLGTQFGWAVEAQNVKRAADYYKLIQKWLRQNKVKA